MNTDTALIENLEKIGIEVKKISHREVACLCPRHEDKSPSFYFNLDTQKYHCFLGCLAGTGIKTLSCQLGGVAIGDPDYVIRLISFPKPKREIIPSIPVLPLAIGNEGEKYLAKRGFTQKTILDWRLMYDPEARAIAMAIEDVGFSYRFLNPADKKKYKHIYGTKMQSTLYGLSKFSTDDNSAILVEGMFDVIWLQQNGFTNALALMHADISKEQVRILKGLVSKVIICLDSDEGGFIGTRNVKRVLNKEFIVKVCKLPDSKDPNDCTPDEITKAIKGEEKNA